MATVDTDAVLAVFRVMAPEFASTADATVSALAGIVGIGVSSDTFGARTSEAIARLCAHELTLQARAAAASAGAAGAGPIASIGAGDLSISFGAASSLSMGAEDDALRQTSHGLAYLAIRQSRSAMGPYLIA